MTQKHTATINEHGNVEVRVGDKLIATLGLVITQPNELNVDVVPSDETTESDTLHFDTHRENCKRWTDYVEPRSNVRNCLKSSESVPHMTTALIRWED